MKTTFKYLFLGSFSIALLSVFFNGNAKVSPTRAFGSSKGYAIEVMKGDTPPEDIKLKYPFKDKSLTDPLNEDQRDGGLKLKDPANISKTMEYDPTTGTFNIVQKVGEMDYRRGTYMDADEYSDYAFKKAVKNYWKQRSHAEAAKQSKALIPKLRVGGEYFDRIFGGNTVDIRPQGSAELIFASNTSRTENPALPVKQRKISTFDFDEKIQLNVIGKIGDKLKLTTNYNTQATFDFENQMKLEYTGYEDEIIKKIEAGNVNLPLTGSLITGSQSLFGIKTQLQFGKITATTIFSQQKGKKSEVNVTGGAQTSKFEISGDAYEANKHYFLSHFYHDQYNGALANLPTINSGVNITKIEVWVTNKTSATENTRNIVALTDLGEEDSQYIITPGVTTYGKLTPQDSANSLYTKTFAANYPNVRDVNKALSTLTGTSLNYKAVQHFEKLENARKLAPTEYTYNPRLGFISLNQALNYDEVLGVAFQYTYQGKVYQVGEFSTDGIATPNALLVKMLKSTNVATSSPMWDLMMKNVYSIGAYQINPQDFVLEVWYNNSATGTDINYLPEGTGITGKPLIQLMNLDKLNSQLSPTPDGVFDFLDGVTIMSANGRVFFPVLEPFGSNLRGKFQLNEQTLANKYVFEQLYDSTKTIAQQFPEKNRYKLKGTYKSSSSSDISLGAPNVPPGSVTVTAGGIPLTENIDYTVDYTLGRVKIINEGILNSGTPIKISLESNSLFNIQAKTLLGTHIDYRINKDFSLGGTVLNLTERPLTRKVNIGDEPISNTIWGIDGNYRTDAPFLTRLVDKIPFIETKAMSSITAAGEYAQLIPGHSKAIGKSGNSYIDDFEGSTSAIDLKTPSAWFIASTPQGQPALFPEAGLTDSLPYGFNRARLSWYVIDPLFLRQTNNLTPSNIDKDAMSLNQVREVLETELFPNKQNPNGQVTNIPMLDLAYYPSERGPYNYDVTGLSGISMGVNNDGTLKNPETRWAGIMRKIETNDFEAANIEFIQFWMMDPYNNDNGNTYSFPGELYFNLGNISEDILKDSRKSFENGLPRSETDNTNPYDETKWGRVPSIQSIVNTFDNDPNARPFQDVGLDGLRNLDEQNFFSSFLSTAQANLSASAYAALLADPSTDDYHYYRGDDYDNASLGILDRYRMYTGMDGNSATQEQSDKLNGDKYPTSATTIPNAEDINRDNTLSESESYYQYKIKLGPTDINVNNVGNNYITDVFQTKGQNIKNGQDKPITWYQFKIPVKTFESKIGSIEDFKSIRFIRMYVKGVDKPLVLRFARLELVRDEWRKYNYDLKYPGEYISNDDDVTTFNVSAVNIEENGSRVPVNYVLPPGIDREVNVQTSTLAKLNEQSMSMRVCHLEDGDSRAAYKNTSMDVRSYKKMQMYVHAEATPGGDALYDNDLTMFIRLGTDYTNNYYEYEVPLKVTQPGFYNGTNEDEQYKVWPDANRLEMSFEDLQKAKQQRNIDMAGNSAITLVTPYTLNSGSNKITVVGNPNLSTLKIIMIGVRNPKKSSANNSDDGLDKCGEIWVNELRLTDFDEKGGWAANARVTARLADFGSVTIAGNMSTPGFGSIEKKVSERQKETIKAYDVSSSVELGKFVPEKLNIKIPMYVGYSESWSTPQYNPLDPDILLKPVLNDANLPQVVRDSLKNVTEDYTRRKSINFTNVKKEKTKGSKKNHIYDVENFAVTYAFNEIYHRNINIEYSSIKNYRGGLTYNYSTNPKNIRPFGKSKSKFLNSKPMALIKDINFYPYPNRFGFTTDIDRQYSESKNRNTTGTDIIIIPTFNKSFTMTRLYDLKYDITKALKMDFSATNDSRVIEPEGRIDTEEKKDSVRESFYHLGKTNHYRHMLNVNYNIPINKLPLMDFATAAVRYSGTYDWARAPIGFDSLGNTITNSRSIQWNGQFNLITLYNKIPYLKKVNQRMGDNKPGNRSTKAGGVDVQEKADTSKGKKAEPKNTVSNPFDYVARLVMTFKSASFSFSDNAGTILPGYYDSTQIMGMNINSFAPGAGFVFGSQEDIRPEALSKGWLIKNDKLNTPYTTTSARNFTARATAEPFKDLKIELNANRNFSKNTSEFFKWNSSIDDFVHESPTETGNFSMSYLTWRTAFKKDDQDHVSGVFQEFLNNRAAVSTRLGQENSASSPLTNGLWDGYSGTSQDVLIPSFLAAYSGKKPENIGLNPFPKVPVPNWRVTYDGFMKFEKVKKHFKTFTLSHAYRSSYNIANYSTNLFFVDNGQGFSTSKDANGDFLAPRQISTVSISEQFSPLIKLDVTFSNSLIANVEMKKDRNLSLGLTGYQLTEIRGNELVVGTGYRFKNVQLPWKLRGRPLKSDINLRANVSIRGNQTVIRKVVENVNQVTSGQNLIKIETSADYVLNERLTVKAFFDKSLTKPYVSSSYPTGNANAGVSVRFTLAQ